MPNRPKVYITRKIPDAALDIVSSACEVRMWPEDETPVPREVLEAEVATVDGMYALLTERVDAPLLQQASNLRVVANMAVGYDNIDLEACTRHGVVATNTPGVLTETTADLTFALLMATARRIVEAQRTVAEGRWKSWYPMMLTGQDVYGATLGIIGAGRIGQAVARRARGFDMRILYHNRKRDPDFEKEVDATYASFDGLLQAADFVVVLVPLTPETRHMIDREALRKMKSSAVLINTARGPVVDEGALLDALRQGDIWAAGLDVFENEPVPPDHPLLELPNVTALPHIGSASIATRMKMAEVAATNLVTALHGDRPPNALNPEVFG